jgi:hypothetical protein
MRLYLRRLGVDDIIGPVELYHPDDTVHKVKSGISTVTSDVILFYNNIRLECESTLASNGMVDSEKTYEISYMLSPRGGCVVTSVYARLPRHLGAQTFLTPTEDRRCCSLVPDPRTTRTRIPPRVEFVCNIFNTTWPFAMSDLDAKNFRLSRYKGDVRFLPRTLFYRNYRLLWPTFMYEVHWSRDLVPLIASYLLTIEVVPTTYHIVPTNFPRQGWMAELKPTAASLANGRYIWEADLPDPKKYLFEVFD